MTGTAEQADRKVNVTTLTAMVIGSMVGGGIFTLPGGFGSATGVVGSLIAWAIAGSGMLMLGLVFQSLALRKPDLDSGIYVYAQEGFGNYAGFNAAWGYWASNIVGNVFFLTFAMASIGAFLPGLGAGNTVLAVICASVIIWIVHLLIMRGIRQAAIINRIVTVAKLLPIAVFVVICVVAFDPSVFAQNFWGRDTGESLFTQVTDTMLLTTFVFLGIEGASVYSRIAQKRADIGRATLVGLLSTLALFGSVTTVSYGVLPRTDLADAAAPSMGVVLEEVVGPWGGTLIDLGVVISVLGAYLAWTLLNAEVMFMPARTGILPKRLGRENSGGTPVAALLLTNISVQIFLLLVLVVGDALDFMLSLDTALTLIPYLLAAAYAVKLTLTRETYGPGDDDERRRQLVIGILAVVYSVFLLYAAGVEYVLLGCLVYAPGTLLYVVARREHSGRVFTGPERIVCGLLTGAAILALVLLGTGDITV